jgi:BirA family biotin operon repressor/biotin-[acetyl-CoA-carboxylase] ligase
VSFGPADYEGALADRGLQDVAVYHRRVTGSTNDDARRLVSAERFGDASSRAIVIAETQTRGRGRGGNSWLSPEGSVAITLIASGIDAARLSALPLAAGASVATALRHLGAPAFVKWPNDILINGLKVGGILCESSLLEGSARVFVGIGINVEAGASDPEVAARSTTLRAQGLGVDRPALVADVAQRVFETLRGDVKTAAMVEQWKHLSVPWWGEEVTILEGSDERRVTLLDVNPDGLLVVRDQDGILRSLVAGDVRRLRAATA